MANKWVAKLQKLEGAVVERRNPFAEVIPTASPSINFIFGNSHGLPLGYTMVLYGGPKSGKSLIAKMMVAELHKNDPEALAIIFNTEYRSELQGVNGDKIFGYDPGRLIEFDTNQPELIFDRIEKDVAAMIQDGAPVKLIIIDSVSSVQGRRAQNATSISTQQIGDHALTIKDGLKRILPVQRKHRIALVLVNQVASEMDQTEVMRGNKLKLAAGFGLQHHSEFFVFVEKNRNKDAKADLLGNEFLNEDVEDMAGRHEQTAHKIRAVMKDSSMGPKGRIGEFTWSEHEGIINIHEEIFVLGVGRGIIERPNNLTYAYKDRKWTGKSATLQALLEDPDLQKNILLDLKRLDMKNVFDMGESK